MSNIKHNIKKAALRGSSFKNNIDTPSISIISALYNKYRYQSIVKIGGLKYIQATGGTEIQIGDYRYHIFNSTDTFTVNALSSVAANNNLRVLVVGGGGGGGADVGGGGSGGQVYENISYLLTSSGVKPVVVGAGGNGASVANIPGSLGSDSSFNGIISIGGGGGGSLATGYPTQGAYGGGAIGYNVANNGANGIVAYRGGNNGIATTAATGGGGGGAGGNGANSASAAGSFVEGGIGILSAINGYTYSKGGRGSSDSWTGSASGTANSGNGGDGSGSPNTGKAGGSGIVIIGYYKPITIGAYTLAFLNRVNANLGYVTITELAALTVFENAVGSDMAEFDRLWIHGLSNSVAARVSFVNPSSTLITEVNSPTFTAGQGYKSNGTTSYLNLNFNLSTQAVKYTRNSASMGIYYNEAPSGVGNGVISGGIVAYLYCVTNALSIGINDGNDDLTNLSTTTGGFYCGVRTSSTDKYGYKNGTQSTLKTRASSGLPNANLYGLALNNSGTPSFFQTARQCLRYYGSSSVNQTTLATAVQTLATTLGFNV